MSNLCYAVSIAGQSKDSEELLLRLWDKAIELFLANAKFSDEALHQLGHTLLFAKAANIKLPQCPDSMSQEIEKAMVKLGAADIHSSRYAKEVSKLLNEIGFDHELEVAPDSSIVGGMLAIDYACKERKLAIEYDGEHHFLKDVKSGKLTTTRDGSSKAKQRLLEELGWTVISLDYRDYIEACQNSNEKVWLRNTLEDAGVILP